ncbi:MAG: DUF2341 domain-containing protein [Kofleriaceae bacterium]
MRWLTPLALCAGCTFSPGSAAPTGDDAGFTDAPREIDASIDGVAPTVWLQPWAHRKAITIVESQIDAPGNGSLANFPVMISVDDDQIVAGSLAAGGADLVFTTSDALTILASEIETFRSNGEIVAWVKIPMLSSTANTQLYVYYGNATPPVATPEAVWTESFTAVWHMSDNPNNNGAILDATSASHDGQSQGMSTSDSVDGKVGRALDFDGGNDLVAFPATTFGSSFTISMWVNMAIANAGIKTLLANSLSGPTKNGFRLFVNTDLSQDHKIHLETGDGTNVNLASSFAAAIIPTQWAYIAVQVERDSNRATIRVNGSDRTADNTIDNDFQTTGAFEIGRMGDLYNFPGVIDEVEVASVIRPSEWLETAYNNQRDPNGFHSLGMQENRP